MNCTKCNRPLIDKNSISRGLGPVCWKAITDDMESRRPTIGHEYYLRHELKEDAIILRRINGHPYVNVYHKVVDHSPTGFEWGYGGSGPAELALNILMQFVPKAEAYQLHQEFKQSFISTAPHEGARIPRAIIAAWIRRKREWGELFGRGQ